MHAKNVISIKLLKSALLCLQLMFTLFWHVLLRINIVTCFPFWPMMRERPKVTTEEMISISKVTVMRSTTQLSGPYYYILAIYFLGMLQTIHLTILTNNPPESS